MFENALYPGVFEGLDALAQDAWLPNMFSLFDSFFSAISTSRTTTALSTVLSHSNMPCFQFFSIGLGS